MITDNPNGLPDIAKYTALLTQTGTNAPTAIVLQNTLGVNPTWVRANTGVYQLQSTGLFTLDKTWIIIAALDKNSFQYCSEEHVSTNFIQIYTRNGSSVLTDGILYKQPIEIRLYNEKL